MDHAANPTLPEEYAWLGDGTNPLSKAANLAVSPLDGQDLFIAANWRPCSSVDGGITWRESDRGADITCTTDIRFLDGTTYVTAMDEGLLASDDNGATWRQLIPMKYEPPLSGHQWRVDARRVDGNVRIISTCSPWAEPQNRVFISDDGGATFRMTREGLPDYRPRVNTMWGESYARALAVDPTDPDVVYLGMGGDAEPEQGRQGGGVFKSTDGGDTWRQLPNQPGSRRMFYGLVVDPTDPQRLYWGTSGEGGGLYRSDDGGGSWRLISTREGWVFNVLVTADGTVYCPGANLWRSTDHGETWEKISDFADSAVIVGLEAHPTEPDVMWISRVTWSSRAVGGVYETRDGGAAVYVDGRRVTKIIEKPRPGTSTTPSKMSPGSSSGANPSSIVMPRAFSCGRRSVSTPVSARISDVLP